MNAVMPDPARVSRRHVLRRALGLWLVLITVEFVHGTLRTIFLRPWSETLGHGRSAYSPDLF